MHSPVTLLIYALCFTVVEAQIPNPYEYDYEDNKKCPLTESIRGGTVSYSAGGEQGSVLTYHCKDGYEPHPVRQRTCSPEGVWIEQVSLVICQEKEGDYDYGDYEVEVKNCSMSEVIEGGNVSYSNLGFEGSMLTYHCQAGYYPYPVSQKICNSEGQWSAMGLPFGKPVTKAKCKEVFCPAQLQLDNGEIWPRQQWFQVGEQQNFSCQDGFVLLGSAQRNCTQWGTWTGSTPVCDNQVDDCQNPGTPPGATRSGERFRTGEKVQYRCHAGLDLLGSSERVCLESREWSGSEPRCLAQYAFDSPSSVAQAMGGSLSGVMDVSSPEFKKKESFGRTFNMADGRINVFILLDTSGSITQKHFDEARDATASLIRKLDSYEVTMKFHIISYASQPKDIVNIQDPSSDNVEYVLDKLQKFNHTSHGQKRGTNLYSALSKVYEAMVFLKAQNSSKFSETQNVILIETDGHLNMGAHPKSVLEKIRDLMGYKTSENDNTKEDLLDVYVFGIGDSVNKKQLNAISSSKRKEKHFFILKDYKQLGEVFNKMISDTAVTTCGIAQEAISKDSSEKSSKKTYTRPWHVQVYWDDLSKKSTTCQGSILTEKWVITAAHCLMKPQDGLSVNATSDKVTVKHGNGSVRARSLHLHPRYNIHGLKAKNVKEFYDYDVALIEVDDIKLSWKARPSVCHVQNHRTKP
ncbi:complement factor B isoform X2 [Chanos chanos]|uniref:C3/C5 convertase n=1 Tax=Chanos chanos TaxID=29144 RepID=A0A6J2VSK6_CHACN|nr:complement factor B-like isoform X2 [Chanos chanos]